MKDFLPYFTNDGSTGLYSKMDDDIYHSTYGALTEAYDKFILPADFISFFKNNSEISILDICFGIGYNSKSFLNFFLENFYKYNHCISTIDTNNILTKKIKIHSVDTDEFLMKISPFIITNKKINSKNNISINRVKKLLTNKFLYKNNYKIFPEVSQIFLIKLFEQFGEKFIDEILTENSYLKFFDKNIINFAHFYQNWRYKSLSKANKSTYLHNIYYQYISKSYKNTLKVLDNLDIEIKFEVNDARNALKSSVLSYDFVFLDAFTPAKVPCLWSYEFINEIYNHMSEGGMLLTYSNSAAVRKAMLENNFYVGKVFNKHEKKFTGTIASKNKNLVEHKLDDYDLGLINSKAGIMYRDNDLCFSNETILENRQTEYKNSNLCSSSKFIKQYRSKNEI